MLSITGDSQEIVDYVAALVPQQLQHCWVSEKKAICYTSQNDSFIIFNYYWFDFLIQTLLKQLITLNCFLN